MARPTKLDYWFALQLKSRYEILFFSVLFLFLWSSLFAIASDVMNLLIIKKQFLPETRFSSNSKRNKKKQTKWRWNKPVFVSFDFHIFLPGTDWLKLHSQFASAFSSLFCCPSISFSSLHILTTTIQPFFTHSHFPFLPHYHLSFWKSDFQHRLAPLTRQKYPSS